MNLILFADTISGRQESRPHDGFSVEKKTWQFLVDDCCFCWKAGPMEHVNVSGSAVGWTSATALCSEILPLLCLVLCLTMKFFGLVTGCQAEMI